MEGTVWPGVGYELPRPKYTQCVNWSGPENIIKTSFHPCCVRAVMPTGWPWHIILLLYYYQSLLAWQKAPYLAWNVRTLHPPHFQTAHIVSLKLYNQDDWYSKLSFCIYLKITTNFYPGTLSKAVTQPSGHDSKISVTLEPRGKPCQIIS